MKFNNLKLDKIENIHFEEFFVLIENNRNRIIKTFPVTVSNCIDLKATEEFIAKNIQIEKEKTGYYFYVRNIENNNLIGYIGIKKIDYHISKCELFYFIDKDFEGKGIISKAISEVIDFCFQELKMNKIFICTSKINFGSQQIALKNGFVHEGTLREEFKNHEGVLEDINYYGLLKSDYER
jgi:ribosomal-protein-serine acetyltransferase